MRTVILYICIFLGVIAAHAQSFLFRLPAFFKDTTEASLQKILLENNILYPDLKLVRHAETLSRFGIHLHFDVLLRGVPLSEAGLILNFYPDGPTGYVTGYIPPEVPVYETAGPGEWYMYWKQYIRAVRIDTLGTIQRYWAQGELLHSRDLASYHKDTTISFPLFLPDPVSVSGKDYGFTVADSNDRDLVAFAALYQTVSVPMEVSKDSIFFKNKFVQIADISGRKRTVSGVPRGSFTVNRSDSLFEALQVLFHIYQYKSYIDSLGFQQLLPMAIPVDPHGTPADQSSFIPTYLIFGDGGVDDAEDAEVIIHEYGHALIEGATPGTNIGFYRKAADEGTCDYLATGYTKQLSLFKPFEIFPWDGHNEFWQGRIINATATFPGGVNNNSIHLTGQLWSSSLNEIATIIGRNTLDQLLLESYYAFSSNLSFQQMAEILMVTDSLLYGGKYHFALCHCFTLRGFINGNCYNGQVSVNEREKPCMRVDHNTLYISNLPDEKWNLSISDLQGKSIYYNRFEGRTISTTHLFASGIYLVTLDSDNGFSYTQKLIMIE